MTVRIEAVAPKDAIAAYETRRGKLTESFAWQDVWQEEHANQITAAKSSGFDIVKDIEAAFARALSEGKTGEQFAKELKPILEKKGWWGRKLVVDPMTGEMVSAQLGSMRRLKIIFETNMRVSYAAGHWASFERTKADRPYLRYVALLDERTRPSHSAHHNLVLRVDDPYWDQWAPPNGWNCRCSLQDLSERDLKRLQREGENLKFQPPEYSSRDYVNRRTGEVTEVPDGIDPGWAYNPGKAGYSALKAAEKLVDASPDLAATYNEMPDWLLKPVGEDFAKWFDEASGGDRPRQTTVVAGALSQDVVSALRERDMDPASGAIAVTQKAVRRMIQNSESARGQEVPLEMLRQIPALLSQPKAVVRDIRDNTLLYIFDLPGQDSKGKLVVRLDPSKKVNQTGSRREASRPNSIRTAGVIKLDMLTDVSSYDLLTGDL